MREERTVDQYAAALQRIEQAKLFMDELCAEPPSPKRDAAITRLDEALSQAIMAVRHLGP